MDIFEKYINPSMETDVNSHEGFIEVKVITQPDNVKDPVDLQDINNDENIEAIDALFAESSTVADNIASMESLYDILQNFGNPSNEYEYKLLTLGLEDIKEDLTGVASKNPLRDLKESIVRAYNNVSIFIRNSINKLTNMYISIFSDADKANKKSKELITELSKIEDIQEREFNFNDTRFLFSNGKLNLEDDLLSAANKTLEIADSFITNRELYSIIHAYGNTLVTWGSKNNKPLETIMQEYVSGPNSRLAKTLQNFKAINETDKAEVREGDLLGGGIIYYNVSNDPFQMSTMGFKRMSSNDKTSGIKIKSLTINVARRLAEVVEDISGKIIEYRNNWQNRVNQSKDLLKGFEDIKRDLETNIRNNPDMFNEEKKQTVKYYNMILTKLWNSVVTVESQLVLHLVDVCNSLNKYIAKSLRFKE